jgi:hypothetical protein
MSSEQKMSKQWVQLHTVPTKFTAIRLLPDMTDCKSGAG